jgi:hypothetical protein
MPAFPHLTPRLPVTSLDRTIAIRDPDGYLIIFTEPTDAPPTTSEPETT